MGETEWTGTAVPRMKNRLFELGYILLRMVHSH